MSDPLGAVLWHLTMIYGFVAGLDDAMDFYNASADEPSPTVGGALAAAIPQAVGAALF